MYAHELYEAGKPQIVVTYPGRFQPFHQGHAGVFAQLQKKFGRDSVYILTSNDQSGAKSPFNFSDKYQLMSAAGVPGDRIIETNQMYKLPDGFDPASTIFITAVGAPDKDRLNPDTFTKRDQKDKEGNVTKPAGSPSYYRTWGADKNPLTADQHGYVIVIPEIQKQITINGKNYDVSHGTECRNLWNQVRNNPKAANEFLQGLYGRATPELAAIFNKIPESVGEDIGQTDSNYSSSPISGARVFHENNSYEYRAPGAGTVQTTRVLNKMKPASKLVWKKPNQIGGSYSEQDLVAKGFKKSKYNSWGGTDSMWNNLAGLDESADYHSKIQEVFKRRLGIVDEVAMNPKAFAQSIAQGQGKGVLVGFEFEVLLPSATVDRPAGTPDTVQYDPNNETWIDGKTVTDFLTRLQPPVVSIGSTQNWGRILDDLFKNKTSVARELGDTSIWDTYNGWVARQVNPQVDQLAKKEFIKVFYNVLENPLPRETVYDPNLNNRHRDEEGLPENATVRDLFVHLLAARGINVNGPKLTVRTMTPEQMDAIIGASQAVYYRTSGPVDRMFWQVVQVKDTLKRNLTKQYIISDLNEWSQYNEAARQPIENFARFCQDVYGSTELKTLLKTKWAFKGRTNNATPVLKEKLWYYLTPGAVAPQSLQTRYSSSRYPDYMKGANFLKDKLAPVFGQNMTVFRGYHQESKKLDRWYIEPDGSLRPKEGDYSAEIVSPPLPAATAMDALKTFYQQAQSLNLYTNNSTGLHINVSIPDKLDVLKLALFVGDQHVLKTFGRENNSYARSVLNNLQGSAGNANVSQKPLPAMEKEMQDLAKRISGDHFATVNFNGKYVSFRHAGGDYLNKMGDIINTVGRFIRAMIIASDPNAYRNEYLAKLMKLVAPKPEQQSQALDRSKLTELLKGGIPGYYMDIAIRPGNHTAQDLQRALASSYKKFLVDLKPDPTARRRMLSSPGFGTPSREHMTNADDSIFFKAFLAPSFVDSLEDMEALRGLEGAGSSAEGIYDQSRNRIAIAAKTPVIIGRNNPLFASAYTALRNKVMAGPKGVLPESVNEAMCDAAVKRATRLAAIYMQSQNLQGLFDIDEYIARKLKSEGLLEGWREKVGAATLAGAMATGAGANSGVDRAIRDVTNSYTAKHIGQHIKGKVTTINGKEYIKHELPQDMSKVEIVTDDNGNKVQAWIEKAGMRPQYTYRFFAPIENVKEQGVAEGSTGVSVRKWANQIRKDHGADIKFWNRKEGGGAVDSVVAKNSNGEVVGVYNRKTGYPTVFEPKQSVAEDAAGVGVVAKNKKMAKDPRYSMSITKDVKPNTLKNSLRAFRLSEDGHSITEEGMMTMIKEFLPLAMKELKLKKVPHIVLQPHVESHDGQATFGRFVNEEEKIYLGIADRHPVDILRTLAHEMVHFKQYEQGKMYPGAGETGSPIENQAHWVAGIIMRHFNKKYPKAIKSKPLEL